MGHRRRAVHAHQAAVLAATQMELAQTQAQLALVQQQQQSYHKGLPPPPPYPGFIGYPNAAQVHVQRPTAQTVTVINPGYAFCTVCRRQRAPHQSLLQMALDIGRLPFNHHHHRHYYCHC